MPVSKTTETPGLAQSAAAGVAWSTISTAGRQFVSIASLATVARLLGPGAYGVMGMATLVTVFIANFRDLGTGTAIVQRLTITDRLLSSLFWVNCVLGLCLSLIIVAASPLAAHFFGAPQLAAILSVIAVSFWSTSLGVVHNSVLLREMRFKALAVADLGSALIGYGVALGCAYSGLGVWSLVFANVAASTTNTAMYWIASTWRPSFVFDKSEVRSVGKFSLNLSGFILVNYASRNSDNIIVGKMLGSAPLGNYQMAYNLMLTPLQNVSTVIAQVTLPAFSQMQNDDARFRTAYIRSSGVVALVTFPMMAGLCIVADPFIRAVLGAKWIAAIPVFQILAPVGLLQSIQTLVGSIYMGKGRTDWMFRFGVFFSVVVVTAFLIGVRFGISGVAWAYFIAYFGVLAYPGFVIPFRLIGLKFRDFAAALAPQILLTTIMSAICWTALHTMTAVGVTNPWIKLVSTSALGVIIYLVGLATVRPPVVAYVIAVLRASNKVIVVRFTNILARIIRVPNPQWS